MKVVKVGVRKSMAGVENVPVSQRFEFAISSILALLVECCRAY